MDNDRLQEIKKEVVERFDYDIPAKYDHIIAELIAALEAAQAELAGRKESNK